MFELQKWIEELSKKLQKHYGNSLCFIGYQGSYRRNEANENSDVDMVIILDKVDTKLLADYKNIINSMPYAKKACGFICGKEELKNWSGYELFQLLNDTLPVYGELKDLIPQITKNDAKTAAKIGAENIYHFACHSFIYSQDPKEGLNQIYKSIVFVIQAKYFYESGEYILTKKELLNRISGIEKNILETSINRNDIPNFSEDKIENSYSCIINYCSYIIKDF